MNLKKIRCSILVSLTHHVALPMLRYFRRPKPFAYTLDQLAVMEDGTLGKDLYHFVSHKKLELLTHYVRHDMKHIVLGYDTTEEGELCLQAFMLGNGRISFPVVATIIFGLCTAPEYWKSMRKAFRKGRNTIAIHQWDWLSLANAKTTTIKANIRSKEILNQV